MFPLPKLATAPFCPSEVRGSVEVDARAPLWTRIRRFSGPGLMVAVGYMDPGNWATDIGAGSSFGYTLLWVVVAAGLAAMLLQMMAARLALVTGQDLAQLCREASGPWSRRWQWLSAEVSIIACDVAEVLGCALAFKLLLGVPLAWGIGLTALDTLIVLGLKGRGFRQIEAIVLGLILTVLISFAVQLALVPPDWHAVARGMLPGWPSAHGREALMLALGIVGATVMPHNLYLHSSVVQTRRVVAPADDASRSLSRTLALSRLDTAVSLALAMVVNGAILVLAGSAFHAQGHTGIDDIEQAHQLIAPLAGSAAAVLFGLALLASGQSSTLTGTIAGQVIMDGFLRLKIPCYQRRLITRGLALLPAWAGVAWLGDGGVGQLLVWSQVVLSLQLPLALWPLIRLSSDPVRMGERVNSRAVRLLAWSLFAVITLANLWLIASGVVGG